VTVKDDSSKLRYHLLPARALKAVVEVLDMGARKYAEENWRTVPDARKRYTSALFRHLEAWRMGEELDPESGLHHSAHVATNALFLLEMALEPRTQTVEEFKSALRAKGRAEREGNGTIATWDESKRMTDGEFLERVKAVAGTSPGPCVWEEATRKSEAHQAAHPYRDPPPKAPEPEFHVLSGEYLDTIGRVHYGMERPKDPQGKPFSDREYRDAIERLIRGG
jgi:hypothetical protein